MKFNAIRLRGLEDIEFRIKDAQLTDKYILKSVDGLNPGDVNVAIANTASGGKYQGRTLVPRQIVMLIGLNPDWWSGETVEELREKLYHMLSTGYDPKVRVQIVGWPPPGLSGPESVLAETIGYVSKFENAMFSKDPAVQITIDCLNAQFKDINNRQIDASAMDQDHPVIENVGSAEAGFQMSVKFTDDMNQWYIKVAEQQSVGMVFNMDFHENDVLSFSTIPGSRYIHWNKRRGKVTNKMGILTKNSEWISLHPGVNHFVVPKANKWIFKDKVVYTPLYWGV